ncbi:MAG: geranylgeranylglyceryl/heptaprenylglyceryl phosphate synthase [bacterium]|nr:geranylgeranylglyceryl/heptaprenylglyceryl phosphate synthase [bacterium]
MVYSYLTRIFKQKGAAFLVPLDPDINLQGIESKIKNICANGADAILVGGSTIEKPNFDEFTKLVKSHSTVPVIIFPGNSTQLSKHADAILFLSLISGRNPEYLIGEHVKASPIIKEFGLEVIPTGYLLIESGNLTSVLFMSHTLPIPRDKPDIAKYHALATEYLGMKLVYLDAGSGASNSVPNQMIREVRDYITIPIIVGGGIRTPADAKSKVAAGAQGVVIGDVLQKEPQLAKDFAAAIHKIK